MADATKPYAFLFSDADREKARARLAPHVNAIESRNVAIKARGEAARAQLKAEGVPRRRNELDDARRPRR